MDLIADVNRLNKRLAERDAQVAKLTRLLEQKDQTIAEMAPVMRATQKRAAKADAMSTHPSHGPAAMFGGYDDEDERMAPHQSTGVYGRPAAAPAPRGPAGASRPPVSGKSMVKETTVKFDTTSTSKWRY